MQNTDLLLVRGDDQLLGVNVTNPDGTPYILSGCNIIFDLRKGNYLTPVILNKVVTEHYDVVSGASYITFIPSDTAKFGTDTYFYDIRLQDSYSKLTTLSYGHVNFYPK
jgi:hypothetical protein